MMEKVGEIMAYCQDENLMQLGFMILSNTLRADFKFYHLMIEILCIWIYFYFSKIP